MMAELKWEITLAEQKSRGKKGLFLVLKAIIYFTGIIFISAAFSLNKDCSTTYIQCTRETFLALLYPMAVPLFMIIYFVIGHTINTPRIRRYVLSENGITFTKGTKTKQYPWHKFLAFYPYRFTGMDRMKSTNVEGYGFELEKSFISDTGEKFWLKKKPLMWGLIKRFVVVYSEPENSEHVRNFLRKYLPEKKLGEYTDFGFVHMEFK